MKIYPNALLEITNAIQYLIELFGIRSGINAPYMKDASSVPWYISEYEVDASNSNERGLQAVKFIIDEHNLEGAAGS